MSGLSVTRLAWLADAGTLTTVRTVGGHRRDRYGDLLATHGSPT